MSYILDALRRADAERERGHVPGLHTQPGSSALNAAAGTVGLSRGGRLQATAAGAVLLLSLLGWLTWRAFGQEAGIAGGSSRGSNAAEGAAPQPSIGTPAVATLPPDVASSVVRPAAVVQSNQPETLAIRPNEQPPSRPARKSALPTAAPAVGAKAAAGALPSRTLPPASPASAPTRVYALDELPEDIRRDLPKLATGGSIYSASSTSRFVILNGQLFHEGDTVAPGLVLQQIKLKSAVLAFRGYRYGISY